jgi:hypothetical protein
VATAVRQKVATFKDRGLLCHQSKHFIVAISLQVHKSPLHYTVYVHSTCYGPRWQPVNVAVEESMPGRWQWQWWQTVATRQWLCSSALGLLTVAGAADMVFAAQDFKFCDFHIQLLGYLE